MSGAFDQRGQTVGQQTQDGAEAFVRAVAERIADLERRLAAVEAPRSGPQGRQVPSVPRMVQYVAYGTPGGEFPAGAVRAAIITEVDEPGNPDSPVGLCVLNPTGVFFNRHLPRGRGAGCWDWPEYVPPARGGQADGR